MEIRKYLDIVGVVCTEAIQEGRMVRLTARGTAGLVNFGGGDDLPGVEYPNTEAEANQATYCVTWPVYNQNFEGGIRMVVPQPGQDDELFALRRGFGGSGSDTPPLDPTAVYLTYPGHTNGVTIPMGNQALAFARGVFKVFSGQYLYQPLMEQVGQALSVANSDDDGGDAGKLQVQSGSETVIAYVEHFDGSDSSLTFRTL